ncbi:LOW QUALITY PROTEIN: uncharacterized protein EMH_0047800 [Eimeria mitis]|uniref:Uncharacterized protein n=1 Tax=Eimeria mitis TaxID=44415 RepID=U6K778_9EIME|nr:LOW QUALITY PROTEIN: uncharacterized protein EMH_0047800 [Eimeria mitis]CDJ32701.1 hypothetical protein EMH_0047800 [Eimeria mitis]
MGHDEDTLPSGPDAVARRCLDRTPNCEDAAEEEQELESLGSDDASTQAWENLKSMHDWLHSPVEQYSDRLCAAGRLQEFVASRGEDWEVNNCCIDGEGRCFFTIARSKFLSPVEERGKLHMLYHCSTGMIFCLDTKEPVARAVVLRFGRGITQSAVISLSLAAHPNSGCVLMVAKSGAEVRNGILSHGSSPLLSLATDCHPLQGDAGLTSMPVSLHDPSVGARTCRRDSVSAADQANTLPAVPRLSDTQGSSEAPSATEPAVTQEGSDDVLQRSRDSTQIRPSSLQQGTGDEAAVVGEGLVQAGRTPVTNNSGRNLQPPNHPTAVREPTHGAHHEVPDALEGGGHKGSADEHSTWWFCPCDGDPSFFFPVAECFDDDAIHNAAQSICRQFRGIASSSVCRAHFEDDGGVALREAKAAAAAARTAEIMLVAAIQTQVPGESELGLKYPSAFPVTSAGKGCASERAMRTAVLKALKEANLAASRAESVDTFCGNRASKFGGPKLEKKL